MEVGLILPARFQITSFAPIGVFEAINTQYDRQVYNVSLVSESGGQIESSLGVRVQTLPLHGCRFDTLLVGCPSDAARVPDPLLEAVAEIGAASRRVVSTYLGVFVLADAGTLRGRKAAAHWTLAEELKTRHPDVEVETNRIHVVDGSIWTSAGMTAGVDLALNLVEHDLGREAARQASRNLVIHGRRAGGQPQQSILLGVSRKSDRVQNVLTYISRNLEKPLSVDVLAEAARLSQRQFCRVFRNETGVSPGKAVEQMRIDRALLMLRQGGLSLEEIASRTGFEDAGHLKRALEGPPREFVPVQ